MGIVVVGTVVACTTADPSSDGTSRGADPNDPTGHVQQAVDNALGGNQVVCGPGGSIPQCDPASNVYAPGNCCSNPTTCTFSGAPQQGTLLTPCGTGGAACVMCAANQQCDTTTYTCVARVCDATNCANGCCDANNRCQTGANASNVLSCGTGGRACARCGLGELCTNNVCTPCGPSNCGAGNCCDPVAGCIGGNSNSSCGTGGAACQRCPSNQLCTNNACVPRVCNASTCPNGCCDADNFCAGGQADGACGGGGAACVSCGVNERCVNRACSTINLAPAEAQATSL
jgi:hypothetical protein